MMSRVRFDTWLISLMVFTSSLIYADNAPTTPFRDSKQSTKQVLLPSDVPHGDWMFSGLVSNEQGRDYGYVFQLRRNGHKFQIISALMDAQSKALLVFYKKDAVIEKPGENSWQVGRGFLSVNRINDSWIFGLQTKNNQGFNFKINMQSVPERKPVTQPLRSGFDLVVSQTSVLNGHLQIGNGSKDEFVTSKHAWFRQVTAQKGKGSEPHWFSSVLCQFGDRSGFYSVTLPEVDALSGAVAGACDGSGTSRTMSQFIETKPLEDGLWHIQAISPKLDLSFSDLIKKKFLSAGFVQDGDRLGFCFFSETVFAS